jgi:hypothetical protein
VREDELRLQPVRRESEAEGTQILPLEAAGFHKRDEAEATTEVDKEATKIAVMVKSLVYLIIRDSQAHNHA